MEKRIEIMGLPDEMRRLVGECELSGNRTIFARDDRAVAMLVSYDEYLALRETIEIAKDDVLRSQIALAEEQAKRGALLLPEDLLE